MKISGLVKRRLCSKTLILPYHKEVAIIPFGSPACYSVCVVVTVSSTSLKFVAPPTYKCFHLGIKLPSVLKRIKKGMLTATDGIPSPLHIGSVFASTATYIYITNQNATSASSPISTGVIHSASTVVSNTEGGFWPPNWSPCKGAASPKKMGKRKKKKTPFKHDYMAIVYLFSPFHPVQVKRRVRYFISDQMKPRTYSRSHSKLDIQMVQSPLLEYRFIVYNTVGEYGYTALCLSRALSK